MTKEINLNITGRKIAFLIADGVCEELLNKTKYALEYQGAQVKFIASSLVPVKGNKGNFIIPDYCFETTNSVLFEAIYIAGGLSCAYSLIADYEALHFICEVYKEGKVIAADRQGVLVLKSSCVDHHILSSHYEQLEKQGIVMNQEFIYNARKMTKAMSHHRFTNRKPLNVAELELRQEA